MLKYYVQAIDIFCLVTQTWEAKSGNGMDFALYQVMLITAQKTYPFISFITIFIAGSILTFYYLYMFHVNEEYCFMDTLKKLSNTCGK